MSVCHDLRNAKNSNGKVKSLIWMNFVCFVRLHQGYLRRIDDLDQIQYHTPGKVLKCRKLELKWSDLDDLFFNLCLFIRATVAEWVPVGLQASACPLRRRFVASPFRRSTDFAGADDVILLSLASVYSLPNG
jgi:hypothetical protein